MKLLMFFSTVLSMFFTLSAQQAYRINGIFAVDAAWQYSALLESDSLSTPIDSSGTFVFTVYEKGLYRISIINGSGASVARKLVDVQQPQTSLRIEAVSKPVSSEAEILMDIAGQANGVMQNLASPGSAGKGMFQKRGIMRVRSVASPPNGRPYPDTFFKHYGTNPFIDTEEDPLSTFAADVDKASFTITRNYLRHGDLPPQEAVRAEEFINYFKTNYPSPDEKAFGVYLDGAHSRFGKNKRLLRIGIRGKDISITERKDAVLTFVIDISGSMDTENRLGLVKRALRVLLDNLRPEDRIGIAVYGSTGQVYLPHTSLSEKNRIIEAIDRLHAGGSTYAEEGIRIGYQMAEQAFRDGAINRIILCSDGVANVGRTGHKAILKTIAAQVKKGITLSTLGFGMANYNDILMEQLADKGNGNYSYIDSYAEALRVFKEELSGILQVIAKDVKLQVEFNPQSVQRYRLIGYENRDVADEDFRNDKVDGGEIGSGHTVTALYELKLNESSTARLGTVRIRFKQPAGEKAEEIAQTIPFSTVQSNIENASGDLRLLAAAAEFAEILRGSYWAKKSSAAAVHRFLKQSFKENEKSQGYYDLLELVKLAEALHQSSNS